MNGADKKGTTLEPTVPRLLNLLWTIGHGIFVVS
jgi:hypothetical protein